MISLLRSYKECLYFKKKATTQVNMQRKWAYNNKSRKIKSINMKILPTSN